jgi:hypothetical protein
MTLILFPSQPFELREIDPDFAAERTAAREAGFDTALLDHTRVTRGDVVAAIGAVPDGPVEAVYRGWMLTLQQYEALYSALQHKGVSLRTAPASYASCHHLPDGYHLIEGHTPRSVWCRLDGPVDFDGVMRLLEPFGDAPLVVKDYVKSQKHYWTEACFIPAANDRAAVERVVGRFLELQGEELNTGLVFREFVSLKIIGAHPKSGMPLAAEFRIFWLHGEALLSHRYWGELTTFEDAVPLDQFQAIAARIPSPFFTMDVALLEGGGWTVVELGDGQVAGLPSVDLAAEFFRRMKEIERRHD